MGVVAGLVAAAALAGYGDPVEGHPSPPERAVQVWIDAARAAPEEFGADYTDGGCSYSDFQPSEQGLHTPFWWHADLAVAARDHAADMDRNEFLGHTSSDGTTWDARLHAIYPYETIGEAVAYDPLGTRHAVLSTWLCSEQHRAILLGPYDEMGVGVSGSYYAVDVGMAGREEWLPVASASQEPAEPTTSVTIRAVWFAVPPDSIEVILDGEPHLMSLVAGSGAHGLYEVTLPTDGDCHSWWIRGAFDGGSEQRWPEVGSYGWGDCAWIDAEALWIDDQVPADAPPPTRSESVACGCSTSPAAGFGLVGLLPLWIRRRRA